MEYLSKTTGWKTILLVQFQPQYTGLILLGVFVSNYVVVNDLAYIISGVTQPGFTPTAKELLYGFDVVYLIDVLTMVSYLMIEWTEAKQLFFPRHRVIVGIDALTCIPADVVYLYMWKQTDLIYSILRMRCSIRVIRLFVYLEREKAGVGHHPVFLVLRELIIVLAVAMVFMSLVLFCLMTNEGFDEHDFLFILYYTFCRTTGKGIPMHDDTPHQALLALIIFAFMCYVGLVYYTAAFISAMMQIMGGQFAYVDSLQSVLMIVNKWKYHRAQMESTLTNFYDETWTKRKHLERAESYDQVIPEVMAKEIKLDLCWDAFKHSHIFRNLDIHYLRYLSSLMTLTHLTPGELVFKKGKFKSRMVYIASGVVQLLSEEDGETPILSLSGGTCLGEISLFIDQPSSCSVVCQSFAEVCILEKRAYYRSYGLYPNNFLQLLKVAKKRYVEAKHYVKVNTYQVYRYSKWNAKTEVLTMRWLKLTLHEMLEKRVEAKSNAIKNSLEDRQILATFDKIVFCCRYLDLLVISADYELDVDYVLIQSTCPFIFQPDSIVLKAWERFVAIISCINLLTYIFYLCLSQDTHNAYTAFIYAVTILWMLDVYIQVSTAVKTKDVIVTDILKIISIRFSSVYFFVDIIACIPVEVLTYILISDIGAQVFHLMQVNRLVKCYTVLRLFKVSKTSSAKTIVFIKYFKYIIVLTLFTSNMAGLIYLIMCQNYHCTIHFIEYLEMRAVNVAHGSKIMLICYFLAFQFMGGLMFGEFPMSPTYWFIAAQVLFQVMEMFFFADIAAATTLRNRSKLNYHEFVFDLNMIMKEWEFDSNFKDRVIKYCNVQWEADNGAILLYKQKLFSHVPRDLYRIGKHIAYAKIVGCIPIFKGLPDNIIATICSHMERSTIPPGEVITYAGEVCKEMYVIENGFCEIISESKTTAKLLGPGATFSVIETCLNLATANTVITKTDCKFLSLTYDDYLRALRYFPEVLQEISYTMDTAFDWVAFEALMNKEKCDVESYTTKNKDFTNFGFKLWKNTYVSEEYTRHFGGKLHRRILRYFFWRITISCSGNFIKVWEGLRAIFAIFTVILSPITIVSGVDCKLGYMILNFLDVTAWLDMYVRLHVSYYNNKGVEVTHPLSTAKHYLSNAFIVDLIGSLPINVIVTGVVGNISARTAVFLRINKQLQFYRVYETFNYFIYYSGLKFWIVFKYFIVILVLLNFMSSVLINVKCTFDDSRLEFDDLYEEGVNCYRGSWLSPNETFQHPLSATRVYAYGVYFMGAISTFKGLEGFSIFKFEEIIETVVVISFWLVIYPYVSARIIASIMYKNVNLVAYQNAMKSLVTFISMKKIDQRVTNEVIEHFEYIWHKKRGRNEQEIFKAFNIALQEDALYHIYGKVLEESVIFKCANKSFFKSLLLIVKHQIVLKRGIIAQVHDCHGHMWLLFKGEVDVLGPDLSYLLTLTVGSLFGNLDDVPISRQTLTYAAKGHAELLSIESVQFYNILSRYRAIRNHFKKLTIMNVDYLLNTTYRQSEDQLHTLHKSSSVLKNTISKTLNFTLNHRCQKIVENLFTRVYLRTTAIKVWETIILGCVCFIGSILELFQKNAQDYTVSTLTVLYLCDILFAIKIYIQFHTAYDDERGLLVTDKSMIARRYLNNRLGFRIDILTVIPVDLIAFCFKNEDTRWCFWTYARVLRLLRVVLVIDFFRGLNNKLNINVFYMRSLYLMTQVILILQGLVYILFIVARTDATMEQYDANITKNFRIMTYLRQVKVLLHMFSGAQIDSFKPNRTSLIVLTLLMMVVTKFVFAMFIAETCTILEIVFNNKINYESYISLMKRNLQREGLSTPLLNRIWLYVKLLWRTHAGNQFPILLEEAPYYLREGVLNSMFGYHIRQHPLLKKCHIDMIRQMAALMRTRVFFAGDYLTFQGDIDECMYFIHEGEVQVLSEDTLYTEIVEYKLKTGQMFGLEQGMYKRCGHIYTYKASTHTIVVILERKWWVHLLDFFPASTFLIYDKNFEKQLLGTYVEPQKPEKRKPVVPIIKTTELRKKEQEKKRKNRKKI